MHDWEFVATSIGCVCGCDHSRLTSGPTVEHHSTSKLSWHTPETQEYPCTHKHTGTRVNSLWHCFTEIFLLLAMDIIAKNAKCCRVPLQSYLHVLYKHYKVSRQLLIQYINYSIVQHFTRFTVLG